MLFLSLKHLFSRKKQTALILIGIVLGTTAYVVISGMMLGFQNYILERLVNNQAHIRISAREEYIYQKDMQQIFYPNEAAIIWKIPPSGRRDSTELQNPKFWFNKLDQTPEVFAYSPELTSQVIYRRNKTEISGKITGSKPALEEKVSNLSDYLSHGLKFTDLGESGNRIIIGAGLLKTLGARTGEVITVATGKGKSIPFKIIGTFNLGIAAIDNSTAFASLLDVQKLLTMPNRMTNIGVKLIDPTLSSALALKWSTSSSDKIESWEQTSAATLSVFKTQDIVRNFMTISILVVAAFGIYNILSILVNQKRKEIAILRAIGFDSGQIIELFMYQGIILGLAGGILGTLLGYAGCLYMSTIKVAPGRLGSASNTMIISFTTMIYVKALALAFFSSLISSFLPSYAAGKLSPIEIIRAEN
ncbi:MAG: ABC transporter permease [Bacteriovorax sp.]|nr:ABC transporter permease [Bacteriovorax sp.]